jgi:hypothetical protein
MARATFHKRQGKSANLSGLMVKVQTMEKVHDES